MQCLYKSELKNDNALLHLLKVMINVPQVSHCKTFKQIMIYVPSHIEGY